MPKSKRNKTVHLTKVKKKGKEHKKAYIEKIQDACDKFAHCYVFHYTNMLTTPFREIQTDFAPGKFFLGKNKVAQVALGKGSEDEYKQNLHLLSKHLEGECGLLFTDKTPEEVLKYFATYKAKTFAKGGVVANETVVLKAGAGELAKFQSNMEPQFRSLGLPTRLENEKIVLEKDVELAKQGEELTVEKAKILRLLGYKIGEFKIKIVAGWNGDGVYSKYD